MIRTLAISAALAFLIASCGSGNPYSEDVPTDSPPVVSRVDPSSGPVGTEITIFGYGFSYTSSLDFVLIGTEMTIASSYSILDEPTSTEIESLTATIPEDAATGENSVVVLVYENASNTDISFTVTE